MGCPILLEAKGKYQGFFSKNPGMRARKYGEWFGQMERQSNASNGLPIEWHFEEAALEMIFYNSWKIQSDQFLPILLLTQQIFNEMLKYKYVRVDLEPLQSSLGACIDFSIDAQYQIANYLGLIHWSLLFDRKKTSFDMRNQALKVDIFNLVLKDFNKKLKSMTTWPIVKEPYDYFEGLIVTYVHSFGDNYRTSFSCAYMLGASLKNVKNNNFFMIRNADILDKYAKFNHIDLFIKIVKIFEPVLIDTLTVPEQGKLPFEGGLSICTSGLVYLSRKHYAHLIERIQGFESINVDDKGVIILTVPEGEFDRDNPEHQEKAQRLWDILNEK